MNIKSATQVSQTLWNAFLAYSASSETHLGIVRPRMSNSDHVRPSALDKCPLRAALEKRHGSEQATPPDYPHLFIDSQPSLVWLVNHGVYVAKMLQDAVEWYASQNTGIAASAEVSFSNDELGMTGAIDLMLTVDGETSVIEIKNRESPQYRSVGEPRLGDVLQMMSYVETMRVKQAYLVIVSRWGFNVYTLYQKDSLWFLSNRFYMDDETKAVKFLDDGRGESSIFDADWNNGITMDDLKKRVANIKSYYNKVDMYESLMGLSDTSDVNFPEAPIQDPYNNPDGWQCVRAVDKGTYGRGSKEGRPAKFVPNCPWAFKCQGVHTEELKKKVKDDDNNPRYD